MQWNINFHWWVISRRVAINSLSWVEHWKLADIMDALENVFLLDLFSARCGQQHVRPGGGAVCIGVYRQINHVSETEYEIAVTTKNVSFKVKTLHTATPILTIRWVHFLLKLLALVPSILGICVMSTLF